MVLPPPPARSPPCKEPPYEDQKKARELLNKLAEPVPYEHDKVDKMIIAPLGALNQQYINEYSYESKLFNARFTGISLDRMNWLQFTHYNKDHEENMPLNEVMESKKNPDGIQFTDKIGKKCYIIYDFKDKKNYFGRLENPKRIKGIIPISIRREYEFLAGVNEESIKHRRHFLPIHEVTTAHYEFFLRYPLCESLADLIKRTDEFFTQQTAMYLASQTLEAIHDVHLHGYIHLDIKPSNFLIGLNENHRCVYITGFKDSYRYAPSKNRFYVPNRPRHHMKYKHNQFPFASRSFHLMTYTRRMDDVESWFYMMLYIFSRDFLPWRNDLGMDLTNTGYPKIWYLYDRTLYEKKCRLFNGGYEHTWGWLKPYFKAIIRYIESPHRQFYDKVDYSYIQSILCQIARVIKFDPSGPLDWEPSVDGSKNVIRSAVVEVRVAERKREAEKLLKQSEAVKKNSEAVVEVSKNAPKKQARKAPSRPNEDDVNNNNKFVTAASRVKKNTQALRNQKDGDDQTQMDDEAVSSKRVTKKRTPRRDLDEAETPVTTPKKKSIPKVKEPEEAETPAKTPTEADKKNVDVTQREVKDQ